MIFLTFTTTRLIFSDHGLSTMENLNWKDNDFWTILFSTHFKVIFMTVIWLKFWAVLRPPSYQISQTTTGVKVNHYIINYIVWYELRIFRSLFGHCMACRIQWNSHCYSIWRLLRHDHCCRLRWWSTPSLGNFCWSTCTSVNT